MTPYDPKPTYTLDDVGCYADGVHGHRHIRLTLADMVEVATQRSAEGRKVASALRKEMSDDAWEEDEALGLLNERCTQEVYFVFENDDLLLVSAAEHEAGEF